MGSDRRCRVFHRLIASACATTLLLGAMWSQDAAGYAPVVGPDAFGVNIQGLVASYGSTLPASQISALLAAISSSGLTTVRVDALWYAAEPSAPSLTGAHTYDWTDFDQLATTLAEHHLRWQPLFNETPPWAAQHAGTGPNWCLDSPPSAAHLTDFAAFAQAFAARYGPAGSFWAANPQLPYEPVVRYEVWNEENTGSIVCPDGTSLTFPAYLYAQMYALTRTDIHSVDPQATVIVGGLVDNPGWNANNYTSLMLESDPALQGNVDGWGIHPYYHNGYTEPPSTAFYQEPIDDVVAFRKGLDSEGAPASEPIYITEIGWTTSGSGIYPAVCDNPNSQPSGCAANRQVGLVTTSDQLMRSNCNVANYMVHTWYTSEADPNNEEDWFGLTNSDATLMPSANSWVAEVQLLYGDGSQPPPSGTVALC